MVWISQVHVCSTVCTFLRLIQHYIVKPTNSLSITYTTTPAFLAQRLKTHLTFSCRYIYLSWGNFFIYTDQTLSSPFNKVQRDLQSYVENVCILWKQSKPIAYIATHLKILSLLVTTASLLFCLGFYFHFRDIYRLGPV